MQCAEALSTCSKCGTDGHAYLDAASTGQVMHSAGQEEMQKTVAQRFQDVKDATWHIVDAARSIEAVQSDVLKIAESAVESCQEGKRLQYLWL